MEGPNRKKKTFCHNMPDASYTCKDALADLDEAIRKGSRPLDPRNVESQQVRDLPNWF